MTEQFVPPTVQSAAQPAAQSAAQPAAQSLESTPQAPAVPRLAFFTGQHYKVHHSYIWLSSLIGVGAVILVALASNLDSILQAVVLGGEIGLPLVFMFVLVIVGVVLVYGAAVGISALAYKHLSFVFDETEFSLYSGILTKRRVHVPYTRVQSVNHKQTLIQRLAGVCTVEIDTAGGAANKAVKVPFVKLDVGEAIRADLFMRKAHSLAAEAGQSLPQTMVPGQVAPGMASQTMVPGQHAPGMPPQATVPGQPSPGVPAYPMTPGYAAPAMAGSNMLDEAALGLGVDDFRGLYGGSFTGMEPVSFERRLNNKELLLASVSHGSTSALGGVGITLAILLGIFGSFIGEELLFILPFLIPLAIIGLVILLAIGMATTALSYGSFSVRRRGGRVEVERGILQRDFSGIDVNRIQSVVIRQSFIRKLMGYCEVSLGRIQAGSAEEQNTQATLNAGGLVVHPFLKLDQVEALLAGLLPEYADRPVAVDFKGLPDIALRRGLLRRCIWRNGLFWTILGLVVAQIAFNVFAPSLGLGSSTDIAQASFIVNTFCIVVYVGFLVQLAFIVLGTFWWKRGSGFAMTEKYLAIRNDGLGTETVYLPRQKIQNVYTRANPFQRMAGVAMIGAETAAGVGGTINYLWDVSEEDALSWLEWLKPRTQFQNANG